NIAYRYEQLIGKNNGGKDAVQHGQEITYREGERSCHQSCCRRCRGLTQKVLRRKTIGQRGQDWNRGRRWDGRGRVKERLDNRDSYPKNGLRIPGLFHHPKRAHSPELFERVEFNLANYHEGLH